MQKVFLSLIKSKLYPPLREYFLYVTPKPMPTGVCMIEIILIVYIWSVYILQESLVLPDILL